MNGFKAWMVPKLRFIKHGMENAKMDAIYRKFDEKDFYDIKVGFEMMGCLYSSSKILICIIIFATIAMFIDEKSFGKLMDLAKIALMFGMLKAFVNIGMMLGKIADLAKLILQELAKQSFLAKISYDRLKKMEFTHVYSGGNINKILRSVFDKISALEFRIQNATADPEDMGRSITNYLVESYHQSLEYLSEGMQLLI